VTAAVGEWRKQGRGPVKIVREFLGEGGPAVSDPDVQTDEAAAEDLASAVAAWRGGGASEPSAVPPRPEPPSEAAAALLAAAGRAPKKPAPALESAVEAPAEEKSHKDRAAPEVQAAALASIAAVPTEPAPATAVHSTVAHAALTRLGVSAPVSSVRAHVGPERTEPHESMLDEAGGAGARRGENRAIRISNHRSNHTSSVWSTEEDESLRAAVRAHSSRNWKAIAAGLDEGLLSFSLSSSRLYGESLEVQQISVTNNIAPS
jgi:hypothetical protein